MGLNSQKSGVIYVYIIMGENNMRYKGIGVSKGIVSGRLQRIHDWEENKKEKNQMLDFKSARKKLSDYYEQMYELAKQKIGLAAASIIQGHKELLMDGGIERELTEQMGKMPAGQAIFIIKQKYDTIFKTSQDVYLAERSADLDGILYGLLNCLTGQNITRISAITPHRIVYGSGFSVEEMLELSISQAAGIIDPITKEESHTCVFAKTLLLPMVTNVTLIEPDNTIIHLDGTTGCINTEWE